MEVTNYLLTGMTLQVLGDDRKFVKKKRNNDNHCQASPVQARKKNNGLTFPLNPGCLRWILIMVYYP